MREDDLRDSRILIVEDQESNIRILTRLLKKDGYRAVRSTRDPRDARAIFQEFQPDLILLDLHMPHMDGFQVMEAIRPDIPEGSFLPILVLTGDRDPEVKIRCLSAGAKDFLSKPFQAEEVRLRIKNLLETRHLHQFLEVRNETLVLEVQAQSAQVQAAQLDVLHRLAVAAEYRDDITGQHCSRVGNLASVLAETAGQGSAEVNLLKEAAPLHDVGKIGIPDAILLKPGRLTTEEFEVMKGHTTIGGMILSKGSFPLLDTAKTIALSHHEWWDGSGYPKGLRGDDIPLVGRIVAIADVFDSCTHERPYKPAFTVDETIRIMTNEGGRHFDPDLLDLFIYLVLSGTAEEVMNATPHGEYPLGLDSQGALPRFEAPSKDPDALSPAALELFWKSMGNA